MAALTLQDLLDFAQAENLEPKDVSIVLFLSTDDDDVYDLMPLDGDESAILTGSRSTFVLEVLDGSGISV